MTIDLPRPDLQERFSHSKINAFTACKAFYKHRYIDRVPVIGTEPFYLLGGAYHAGMEHLYRHHPGTDPGHVQASVKAGIDAYWQTWFEVEGIGPLLPEFQAYEVYAARALDDLAFRASAACTDPHRQIRNRDGAIPKALAFNGTYKRELARLGLDTRMAALDQRATALSPTLQASALSLADVYATAYGLGRQYRDFDGLIAVHGVELGFTQAETPTEPYVHAVSLQERPLQGFIDLLVELDGHGLTLIDHKTATSEASFLDVLYNEQLNLYAFALQAGFGLRVAAIGINNARFGSKVIVPVDWQIVAEVISRKEASLRAIAAETEFLPQDPLNHFVAMPCLGRSTAPYTSDNLRGICPYLSLCHPQVDRLLTAMIRAEG